MWTEVVRGAQALLFVTGCFHKCSPWFIIARCVMWCVAGTFSRVKMVQHMPTHPLLVV